MIIKKRIDNEWKKIFKWDKISIRKCILKSELLKAKNHCLSVKQYKNLENILSVIH